MEHFFAKMVDVVLKWCYNGDTEPKTNQQGGNTMEKLLYTQKELLESGLFPGGRNALYNLLQTDTFPKLRIGHRLYIPRDGYLRWVEENSCPAAR